MSSETWNFWPVARATSQPWRASSAMSSPAISGAGVVAKPRSISPSQTRGSAHAATARSSCTAYASAQPVSAAKSRAVARRGASCAGPGAPGRAGVQRTQWLTRARTSRSPHPLGSGRRPASTPRDATLPASAAHSFMEVYSFSMRQASGARTAGGLEKCDNATAANGKRDSYRVAAAAFEMSSVIGIDPAGRPSRAKRLATDWRASLTGVGTPCSRPSRPISPLR